MLQVMFAASPTANDVSVVMFDKFPALVPTTARYLSWMLFWFRVELGAQCLEGFYHLSSLGLSSSSVC